MVTPVQANWSHGQGEWRVHREDRTMLLDTDKHGLWHYMSGSYQHPVRIMSAEALFYLGFTWERSVELWTQWDAQAICNGGWRPSWNWDVHRPAVSAYATRTLMASFRNIFANALEGHGTAEATEDDDKWRECMDKYGINQPCQDILLGYKYIHMRWQFDCVKVLRDVMEDKFFTSLVET